MNAKKIASALALAGLLSSGIALAQTTTSSTTGTVDTTTTTPGAPNTGAGGDAATNMLLLATSGIVALAGVVYLTRKAVTR